MAKFDGTGNSTVWTLDTDLPNHHEPPPKYELVKSLVDNSKSQQGLGVQLPVGLTLHKTDGIQTQPETHKNQKNQ